MSQEEPKGEKTNLNEIFYPKKNIASSLLNAQEIYRKKNLLFLYLIQQLFILNLRELNIRENVWKRIWIYYLQYIITVKMPAFQAAKNCAARLWMPRCFQKESTCSFLSPSPPAVSPQPPFPMSFQRCMWSS